MRYLIKVSFETFMRSLLFTWDDIAKEFFNKYTSFIRNVKNTKKSEYISDFKFQ